MPRCAILLNLGIFLFLAESALTYSRNCGRSEYEKCVQMADPLLTDAHMIFPDNMVDIDSVCRKWTEFVDCIRSYIDNCFTESRRQQFNQAVEIPVDAVHQMCTSSSYQQEYLQHATCLKNTLTDDRICGRHYRYLAGQVQSTKEMDKDDLCCSHNRFRECVLEETRRTCDSTVTGSRKMLPSGYSRQFMDKSLNFLREQCSEYRPAPGECMGYQPSRYDKTADELTDTTHGIGPTYSIGPNNVDAANRETEQEKLPATLNPLTWIPSRDGRRRTTDPEADSTPNEPSTRSSYGRGVTWEPTMSRDDLFKATHYRPSTESWYPGNNINYQKEVEDFDTNNVEEPNQQGLAHFDEDNAASCRDFSVVLSVAVSLLVRLLL